MRRCIESDELQYDQIYRGFKTGHRHFVCSTQGYPKHFFSHVIPDGLDSKTLMSSLILRYSKISTTPMHRELLDEEDKSKVRSPREFCQCLQLSCCLTTLSDWSGGAYTKPRHNWSMVKERILSTRVEGLISMSLYDTLHLEPKLNQKPTT